MLVFQPVHAKNFNYKTCEVTSLAILISAQILRIEKLKMTKRDLTMGGSIVTHEGGWED